METTISKDKDSAELREHVENWLIMTFERGQNSKPPFDQKKEQFISEALGKIMEYSEAHTAAQVAAAFNEVEEWMLYEVFHVEQCHFIVDAGGFCDCGVAPVKRKIREQRARLAKIRAAHLTTGQNQQ
jgi:hypothetical protein